VNPRPQSSEAEAEHFELVALAEHLYSLRSCANGETFHPVVGPMIEARSVHLGGSDLLVRVRAGGETPFVIWDVGLGAGANALAVIDVLSMMGVPRDREVHLLSFDRSLAALGFALEHTAELDYLRGYEPAVRALCETGSATIPLPAAVGHDSEPSPAAGEGGGVLNWRLHLDDFPSLLASDAELPTPHAIFYDPYSPKTNPEMWMLPVFEQVFRRLRPEVPCTLTTYTRSTAMRVTLLLAGFFVGPGGPTGEKDETTVASNNPTMLLELLPRRWLDKRVIASTSAAPFRTIEDAKVQRPISKQDYALLREHPQFV
jgi:tRNA U34 5-methylaminomethyl-2-thiouridine-forming methyltransferase MnmC